MEKKLDIIIPVYNNADGLFQTLCSLGQRPQRILNKIIIIDDCSTENNEYESVCAPFQPFFDIDIYRLETNVGPGGARNAGLMHASVDYVMFIDCGDIVYDGALYDRLPQILEENNGTWVFSFAHLGQHANGETFYVGSYHNRMMGKIYLRGFLQQYGLTFAMDETRCNEDIGFNHACRLVCTGAYERTGEARYTQFDETLILWTYDEKSITRENNHDFYNRQGMGLAKNMIHAIETARRSGTSLAAIRRVAYDIIATLYIFYIAALNVQPEYADINLEGAKAFYDYYFGIVEDMKDFDTQTFVNCYYNCICGMAEDRDEPFFAGLPALSIIDFLSKLQNLTT